MAGVFFVARPRVPFLRACRPRPSLGVAHPLGRPRDHAQPVRAARRPLADARARARSRASRSPSSWRATSSSSSCSPTAITRRAAAARARVDASRFAAFSSLGHEILGSVSLGTTLGLVLAAYLKLSGRQLARRPRGARLRRDRGAPLPAASSRSSRSWSPASSCRTCRSRASGSCTRSRRPAASCTSSSSRAPGAHLNVPLLEGLLAHGAPPRRARARS